MWDLPEPEVKPVSPALARGFLTTGPPGKFHIPYFYLPPLFDLYHFLLLQYLFPSSVSHILVVFLHPVKSLLLQEALWHHLHLCCSLTPLLSSTRSLLLIPPTWLKDTRIILFFSFLNWHYRNWDNRMSWKPATGYFSILSSFHLQPAMCPGTLYLISQVYFLHG